MRMGLRTGPSWPFSVRLVGVFPIFRDVGCRNRCFLLNDDGFRLLPEGASVHDYVDDAVFTDVTDDGEVYTLYRIVRVTHEATNESLHWTHRANVAAVRSNQFGVALLRVINRVIQDSRVTITQNVQ